MTVLGRVGSLWRYPVKSMQGEQVESVAVGERGIEGDRHFAVVDRRTGKVLSAKTEPVLLEAFAELRQGRLTVFIPTGDTVHGTGRETDMALSNWLRRLVHLEECGPDERGVLDAPETPEGDGPLHTFETPPGTFVDAQPVHLVTTASLGRWDVRRFRPNVVVDGAGEDDWVGASVRAGGAGLVVRKRTTRCVVVTREQPEGVERDLRVVRALRGRDVKLGVYARVAQPGRISIGDEVCLDQ